MLSKFLRSLLKTLAIAAFWILIWHFAAMAVDKELFLPAPLAVLKRLFALASTKEFYITTATSLLRVMSGIISACAIGIILAILTHVSKIADALSKPLLTIIKATPVASFIILALVWIARDDLPIFISLLMVLPVVWTNLRTGLAEIDRRLLEMAKVFRASPWQMLKSIYIPSVFPYFTAAAKTSLGLAWKAGIAAEVLATPAKSIGKELFNSRSYLETVDLFAWTVVVIILSLVIELAFEALIAKLTRKRRIADA